jgi:hypothetical protein
VGHAALAETDLEDVAAFVGPAALVIAHNARFEATLEILARPLPRSGRTALARLLEGRGRKRGRSGRRTLLSSRRTG